MKCPLCNEKIKKRNKSRMEYIYKGIQKENLRKEKLKKCPDYISFICEEVIMWTLYQEEYKKFSAPVEIEDRIKEVISIHCLNEKINSDVINLVRIHILNILIFIETYPTNSIVKSYKQRATYFDISKYTRADNTKFYNISFQKGEL